MMLGAYFSFAGRIGRLVFFRRILALFLVELACAGPCVGYIVNNGVTLENLGDFGFAGYACAAVCAAVVAFGWLSALSLRVRRLRDTGLSWMWLVPVEMTRNTLAGIFFGLVEFIITFFAKGKPPLRSDAGPRRLHIFEIAGAAMIASAFFGRTLPEVLAALLAPKPLQHESAAGAPKERVDPTKAFPRMEWPKTRDGMSLTQDGARFMEEGWRAPTRKDLAVSYALYDDGKGRCAFLFKVHRKTDGAWVEAGGGMLEASRRTADGALAIEKKEVAGGVDARLSGMPSRSAQETEVPGEGIAARNIATVTFGPFYADFHLPRPDAPASLPARDGQAVGAQPRD